MSEGLFNVYIERARSETPDAAAKLAQAMAAHYGIDATAIEQRLGVGRFRVKGNVDRATADAFAADLTKLGAVVKVERAEEATPPPPAAPAPEGKAKRNRTPPTGVKIPSPVSLQQPRVAAPVVKPVGTPAPAPKPTPAPVAKPTPAPAPAPKPAPKPAPAASEPPARPSQPQFTSGLAAAASKSASDSSLDAWQGDVALNLATLDGADDNELSASRNVGLPASFGPPSEASRAPAQRPSGSSPAMSDDDVDVAMDDDGDDISVDMPSSSSMDSMLPASIGPAASGRDLGASLPASMGPAASPRELGGVSDMFAPPDAQEEIALALDVEPPKKKPPSVMAAEGSSPSHSSSSSHASSSSAESQSRVPAQQAVARAPGEPAWKTYGKDERVRFVAGVVIAAAIGCVPALVTASVRKRSAFADLDGQLERQQSQVLTRADWDNLDRVRASFVERKKSEQQSIALTSLLLWAAVSGGVAFVWFRKIDWDRLFR